MKPILLTSLLAALLAYAPLAQAQQAELAIVAIVNDEVVTSLDVADRVAFVMATANLPNAPATIERIIPQVTRQLIDEKLQLQEAARHGLNVTDAEVNEAVKQLAQRQNITPEQFLQELEGKNIPKQTFTDQIRAQLAWQNVVARKIRPDVKVTDAEVERARLTDSLQLTAGEALEVEIMSLILPVDKPDEENQVKALAEQLVKDIKAGADFEQTAAQFGGKTMPEPIWVPLVQLDPGLASALSQAVPGSVSKPARTLDGYVIIKLLNRRGVSSAQLNDSQLLIKDMLLSLNPDDAPQAAELSLAIAQDVARHPGDCKTKEIEGIDSLKEMNIEVQFIHAQFSELSEPVQKMVANLSVGAVSEPFASPEGIRVMMLCERTDAPPELAEVEATYTQLMNKKLDLETRKYMRNLRRDAFIEFRGNQSGRT